VVKRRGKVTNRIKKSSWKAGISADEQPMKIGHKTVTEGTIIGFN
jgi:hypothetical protein